MKGENKVEKQNNFNIFLVLGAVWVIVGLLIYNNPALWPLGIIFLIVGLISKLGVKNH